MHIGSAVQGASAVRRWLMVLLAVVLVVTWVTLLALTGAFASGVGAENAIPNAVPNIDLSGKVTNVH